jgi:hypothetical protein
MAATKPYTPPYGQYQGTELHRNPGMPAARTAAFDLPSRVGPRLHYPDGTVKPFPATSNQDPA